jgi:hypothetical protein
MPSSAWDDWKSWPKHAPDGCVFLGAAFERLARAKFGTPKWGGWRAADKVPGGFPTVDVAFVDGLPVAEVHDHWRKYISRVLIKRQVLTDISEDDWQEARFRWWDRRNRAESARKDRQWLVDEMTNLAQRGDLVFVYRLKDELKGDHNPVEMSRELWQTSDPFPRYQSCAFNPARPRDAVAEPTSWLFVTKRSLDDAEHYLRTGERPASSDLPSTGDRGPVGRRRGRTPDYDWEEFYLQVALYAATHPDGLPRRAVMLDHMLQWCENHWGRQPSPSQAGAKLDMIYHQMG